MPRPSTTPVGALTEIPELKFPENFGMGLTHMALAILPPPNCARCEDTGLVGHPAFPVSCPDCVGG